MGRWPSDRPSDWRTVTAGIVSKQRDRFTHSSRRTVAINPGNSGPLINMRGEGGGHQQPDLLPLRGFMGISFSVIPIDGRCVSVVLPRPAVSRYGRIRCADLALSPRMSLNPSQSQQTARRLGRKALNCRVLRRKAGLEAGDIIVKFDGKPIEIRATYGSSVTPSRARAYLHSVPARQHARPAGGGGRVRGRAAYAALKPTEKGREAQGLISGAVPGLTVSNLRRTSSKGGVRVDAASDTAARAEPARGA